MTLRRAFIFLFLLLCVPALAYAQIGIHGAFNYTHENDASANSSFSLYGGTVGVFDELVHLGPVRAGVDLRGTFDTGNQLHARTLLFGPRVAVKIPLIAFKPYGQFLVGVGGTSSQAALEAGIASHPYSNKFTYEVLGGLDTSLLPHLDLRVLEIGYGQQNPTDGSPSNHPATKLVTVGAGLVLRL